MSFLNMFDSNLTYASQNNRRTHCRIKILLCLPTLRKQGAKKGRTIQELHQVIEWLTGFDEKAIQYYNIVLDINPTNIKALYGKGLFYQNNQMYSEAVKHGNQIMETIGRMICIK